MPRILSANRSKVLLDGEVVEGLQSVSYATERPVTDIAAIGEPERVGVVLGITRVSGVLVARSAVPALDVKLAAGQPFQIVVSTMIDGSDGEEEAVISLQECYATNKRFGMGVGGVAEMLYDFTATREGAG